MALTVPFEVTVAMALLVDFQVTFLLVALVGATVAPSCAVLPLCRARVVLLSFTDLTGWMTVTLQVGIMVEAPLAVITVTPGDLAVNKPPSIEIVATFGLLDVHFAVVVLEYE